jgi:uncharacterized protein YihD (DUF1040 family)
MRDPKRIDKMLTTIKTIWKTYPDLRLLQLLINCLEPGEEKAAYYLEDYKLEERLKKQYYAGGNTLENN